MGPVEQTAKRIVEQVRIMTAALETTFKVKVETDHPI